MLVFNVTSATHLLFTYLSTSACQIACTHKSYLLSINFSLEHSWIKDLENNSEIIISAAAFIIVTKL